MKRLLLLVLVAVGSAAAAQECDLGPIIFFEGDESGDQVLEALGPIWESFQDADSGTSFLAIRPIYAGLEDATGELSVQDFLWPLGHSRREDDSHRWRFFPLFGYNRDVSDPESAQYVWLFPLVFCGKDQEGVPYFALFPIGGTIRGVLARDRIFFLLFPLYVRTSGRGRDTWDVLFPVFSRTKGEGVSKFRVFPIYGQAVWDGESKSVFVLWPFFTWKKSLDEEHPGRGFLILPLWGQLDTPEEKKRTFLWPFFRYQRVENGKAVDFPWPFLRYSSIPDMERRHIWPLWGSTKVAGEQRYFSLWPLFRYTRREAGDEELTRKWILPLAWQFRHQDHGVTDENYRRIWPLVSSWKMEDWERVRALDPWPWKNTRGVEWNWAPWWTVVSAYREADDHRVKYLWGMMRSRRKGEERRDFSLFPLWDYHREGEENKERRSWSILKGLFGVEQREGETETRFLYFFRFRKQKTRPVVAESEIGGPGDKATEGTTGDEP